MKCVIYEIKKSLISKPPETSSLTLLIDGATKERVAIEA